jgi:hypothetical protein
MFLIVVCSALQLTMSYNGSDIARFGAGLLSGTGKSFYFRLK